MWSSEAGRLLGLQKAGVPEDPITPGRGWLSEGEVEKEVIGIGIRWAGLAVGMAWWGVMGWFAGVAVASNLARMGMVEDTAEAGDVEPNRMRTTSVATGGWADALGGLGKFSDASSYMVID